MRTTADADLARNRAADRLLRDTALTTRGRLIVLAVATVIVSAAELALPAMLGVAVDTAFSGGSALTWVLGCLGLLSCIVAGDAVSDLAAGVGAARATAGLRARLARHLVGLTPAAGARLGVGDTASRVVGQATDAGQGGVGLVLAGTAILPAAGSAIALLVIDVWVGAMFFLGLALLAVLLRVFVADTATAVVGYQNVQGRIATRLTDALAGARTIAACHTLDREAERVLADVPELSDHGHRMWRLMAGAAAKTAGVAPLLQVSVLAVGGALLVAGRLSPGELFAASQYAVLGAGLGGVIAILNRLGRARAACRRAADLLALPVTAHGTATLPSGDGTLRLRDVTVRVDGVTVLDGIDTDIPGGIAVAVVGRDETAKSALAGVIGRLVDPEGDVLLDGVPLRQLDRAVLREAVGYAFRRPVLLGATVADAIGWGRPWLAQADIAHAASTAAADSFVRRLPDGYATPVRPGTLSGGEVQRLGLARASFASRVLVLDDAMSSVDTATEYEISRVLVEKYADRTRVIVASRASTAARADSVLWLDGTRLRGCGAHHDLWRESGYRAVFGSGTDSAGGP